MTLRKRPAPDRRCGRRPVPGPWPQVKLLSSIPWGTSKTSSLAVRGHMGDEDVRKKNRGGEWVEGILRDSGRRLKDVFVVCWALPPFTSSFRFVPSPAPVSGTSDRTSLGKERLGLGGSDLLESGVPRVPPSFSPSDGKWITEEGWGVGESIVSMVDWHLLYPGFSTWEDGFQCAASTVLGGEGGRKGS